jgi:hypothetical protein
MLNMSGCSPLSTLPVLRHYCYYLQKRPDILNSFKMLNKMAQPAFLIAKFTSLLLLLTETTWHSEQLPDVLTRWHSPLSSLSILCHYYITYRDDLTFWTASRCWTLRDSPLSSLPILRHNYYNLQKRPDIMNIFKMLNTMAQPSFLIANIMSLLLLLTETTWHSEQFPDVEHIGGFRAQPAFLIANITSLLLLLTETTWLLNSIKMLNTSGDSGRSPLSSLPISHHYCYYLQKQPDILNSFKMLNATSAAAFHTASRCWTWWRCSPFS